MRYELFNDKDGRSVCITDSVTAIRRRVADMTDEQKDDHTIIVYETYPHGVDQWLNIYSEVEDDQ